MKRLAWLSPALACALVATAPAQAATQRPRPAAVRVSLSTPGDITVGRVTVQLSTRRARLRVPKTVVPRLTNRARLPGGIGLLARTRKVSHTRQTAKYHVYVVLVRPAGAQAGAAALDAFARLTFAGPATVRASVSAYVESQDSYAEGGIPDEDVCLAYEYTPPATRARTRNLIALALGTPPESAAKLFDDALVASCPDLAVALGRLSPGFVPALTGGASTGSGDGRTRQVVLQSAWPSTVGCASGVARSSPITVANPGPGQSNEYYFSPLYPDCAQPPYEDGAYDATTGLLLDGLVFSPATNYSLVEQSCEGTGDPTCTKVRLRLVVTNSAPG